MKLKVINLLHLNALSFYIAFSNSANSRKIKGMKTIGEKGGLCKSCLLKRFDSNTPSIIFLLGSEKETRLLQNPPCESRQSLLTSFVQILQILERRHLGSVNQKDSAVLSPLHGLEKVCSTDRNNRRSPCWTRAEAQCAYSHNSYTIPVRGNQ